MGRQGTRRAAPIASPAASDPDARAAALAEIAAILGMAARQLLERTGERSATDVVHPRRPPSGESDVRAS